MTDKTIKDKVLCYIARDGRSLVFRHTDHSYEEVGIQIPGTGQQRCSEAVDLGR
ncbi:MULTISPECIES: hypothetical protein [Thermomonosporaceae]|uniref:hypothetical protein n=1 Tax=Thermomonosporaceae TaxID=2012 RepID=UPI00255ABC4C|nr:MULTISPECIES: hypothetical protein [Thermomonosporaceae]MDL4773637.1 hypothetical protein [Actinomadura xylanilytica]